MNNTEINGISPLSFPGKITIGLTGPIAGGKSLALSCFKKYGAYTVSADEVNKEILDSAEIFAIISSRYAGSPVIDGGRINKKELAEIIFNFEKEKKWLEDILHPRILTKIFDLVKNTDKNLAVIELPLLFEAGLQNLFSLTMCIYVPDEKLYERAAIRGWTRQHFEKRCRGQFPLEKKCSMADLVIQNNSTQEIFEGKIRKICGLLTGPTCSGKAAL